MNNIETGNLFKHVCIPVTLHGHNWNIWNRSFWEHGDQPVIFLTCFLLRCLVPKEWIPELFGFVWRWMDTPQMARNKLETLEKTCDVRFSPPTVQEPSPIHGQVVLFLKWALFKATAGWWLISFVIIEGSLEVKLPTIWTDEKQRWEESEKRREEERKRKSEKKECPGARKGRKVAKHSVFPMICGSGGSKSRLAKAAGAEPAGQMRDEKLHAVVARSTFPSQNIQNTACSDHVWKLRCRKSTQLWREAHFEVNSVKTDGFGSLFEDEMSKKCTPLRREAHFEVKICKAPHMLAPLLDVEASFCVAGARDCAPCQKWAKREAFVAFPKTMAGMGHLKRICKDAFSVAGAVQETCSSELLRGPDADVLRRVAYWNIRSSGLLRWFCVTGAALRRPGITFSWQAQYFRQVEWKTRKTHCYEAVSSALNFPFLKEVSLNCFVFHVVNFKNWGNLADLFRFWCCQVQKLRKSRRIVPCLTLSCSKSWESLAQ